MRGENNFVAQLQKRRILGVPYEWIRAKEEGDTFTENGISDISLEVKWRFYEKDGLSFALKPGISMPTGDEEKGLGAGRVGYRIFFITTKEIAPWAFHLNLGYIRNENKAMNEKTSGTTPNLPDRPCTAARAGSRILSESTY